MIDIKKPVWGNNTSLPKIARMQTAPNNVEVVDAAVTLLIVMKCENIGRQAVFDAGGSKSPIQNARHPYYDDWRAMVRIPLTVKASLTPNERHFLDKIKSLARISARQWEKLVEIHRRAWEILHSERAARATWPS